MYDVKDPRSALNNTAAPAKPPVTALGGAEYLHFYREKPAEDDANGKTWYGRGQNFILSASQPKAGAEFVRQNNPDEYAILLPDRGSQFEVSTDKESKIVEGGSLVFVPPGYSKLKVIKPGQIERIFTTRSEDLVAKCSNKDSYKENKPNVALLQNWPDPPAGFKIRAYDLNPPPTPGRFGRIWRCTTIMVNFCEHHMGPRDPKRMSPHFHDDFEQCSLAIEGEFIHHLRWPWGVNKTIWREDDHERMGSPSVAVIPPPAVHTTEASGPGKNQLVDIFCPPRMDFSSKPGWVLNADEYPMPQG